MSYYPTIDEDLLRAREILARGTPTDEELGPLAKAFGERPGAWIYGADVYAASQLLASFVEEIDRLRGLLTLHESQAAGLNATAEDLLSQHEQVVAENTRLTQLVTNILGDNERLHADRDHVRHLNAVAEDLIRQNLRIIDDLREDLASKKAERLAADAVAFARRGARQTTGRGLDLFAYIGEDELGSGEVGLKQAAAPAGIVPLVAVDRAKLDRADFHAQLEAQATQYGKPIRLVRFIEAETVLTITPRS